MARVTTYLNFPRSTEEAFNFYRTIFGTEFIGPIMRFGSVPSPDGQPGPSDADKDLVMHVALPILGGHVLMGTDAPDTMGFTLTFGNNIHINLEPDTKQEADQLFEALSQGGTVGMPLTDMYWGAYFGFLTDKYGVHWMFNVPA